MSEAPTIVVTGMCNTKGVEIRFLAEQVAEHGGKPLVMDLSLGGARRLGRRLAPRRPGGHRHARRGGPRGPAGGGHRARGPRRRRQDPGAARGRPLRRDHLVGRGGRDDDGDAGHARAAVRRAEGDADGHGVERRQPLAREQGHLHRQPDRRAGNQRGDAQDGRQRHGRRRRHGPGSRRAGRVAAALRDHLLRLDDAHGRPLRRLHGASRLGRGRLPRRRRPRGHDGGPRPLRDDHRGHRPHDRGADEHPAGQRLRHARGLGGRAPHGGRRRGDPPGRRPRRQRPGGARGPGAGAAALPGRHRERATPGLAGHRPPLSPQPERHDPPPDAARRSRRSPG